MSESTPESTPDVNVEGDQTVVNTAPDGGGVDVNEATPEETPAPSDEGQDNSDD